ncbi:MAG: CoA-binding protein [Crocinitomix sp.]|nr:CoA-binding protein [Crocinitomix sp.]
MKVLVLGASLNPRRYSFLAINDLLDYGHDVLAIGKREGELRGVQIFKEPMITDIDTVTVYLGAKNQVEYYDYLIQLNPARVIFNPGAENYELEQQLTEKGVEVLSACTLVMLRTNQFE